MILQALIEGGWQQEKEEDEKDKTEDTDLSTEPSENSLVQSILKGGKDEHEMVRSALDTQNVSRYNYNNSSLFVSSCTCAVAR